MKIKVKKRNKKSGILHFIWNVIIF